MKRGMDRWTPPDAVFRVDLEAPLWHSPPLTDEGPMRTHDLENHDNLYADEVGMEAGETRADALNHALLATGAILLMVAALGVVLIIS